MSKSNRNRAAVQVLRTVNYLRKSDHKQENSITNQRGRCERFAKEHDTPRLTLVGEYVDEGVSGVETTKRPDFQRMLAAAGRREFDAVLVDALDRFGRLDAIDMGEVLAPLRRKGIRLFAVNRGELDLNTMAGRLMTGLDGETARGEHDNISRRALGAMLTMAQQRPMGGKVPFGYRVEREIVQTTRGPKSLPKRLIIEEREARVVRLCFELAAGGKGLRTIIETLYQRGILSPSGQKRWNRAALKRILMHPVYTGDRVFNRRRAGKSHRAAANGELVPKMPGEKRHGFNDTSAWVVTAGAHEPLVDRDTFQKAQETLRRLGAGYSSGERPYFLLRKLLVCGSCGSPMIGQTEASGRRMYACGAYVEHGKTVCARNPVPEQALVRTILATLKRELLNPETLDRIRRLAREEAARMHEPSLRAGLQRQADEVENRIRGAAEKLALLSAGAAEEIGRVVEQWRAERAGILAELKRLDTERPTYDAEAIIRTAEEWLWRLDEAADLADTTQLRELLLDSIHKVELRFKLEQRQVYQRSKFLGGTIHLRTDNPETNLVSLLTGIHASRTLDFSAADLQAAR